MEAKLLFNRIRSQLFPLRKNPLSEKAIKNIEQGEIFFVNGKTYRKVKIRMVDTWDGNTTAHIDNLEQTIGEQQFTIAMQAAQITKLKQSVEKLNVSNAAMQQLNINLHIHLTRERKHLTAQFIAQTNEYNKLAHEIKARKEKKLQTSLEIESILYYSGRLADQVLYKEPASDELNVLQKLMQANKTVTELYTRQKKLDHILLGISEIQTALEGYFKENINGLTSTEQQYQRLKHNYKKLEKGLLQIKLLLNQSQ